MSAVELTADPRPILATTREARGLFRQLAQRSPRGLQCRERLTEIDLDRLMAVRTVETTMVLEPSELFLDLLAALRGGDVDRLDAWIDRHIESPVDGVRTMIAPDYTDTELLERIMPAVCRDGSWSLPPAADVAAAVTKLRTLFREDDGESEAIFDWAREGNRIRLADIDLGVTFVRTVREALAASRTDAGAIAPEKGR